MHPLFRLAVITLALASPALAKAQQNCPDSVLYKPLSMGNGVQQLPIGTTVLIFRDTIWILPGHNFYDRNYLIKFAITSRKCDWNHDKTYGESSFDVLLMPEGKKATVRVILKEKKQINIHYEYSKELIVLEW